MNEMGSDENYYGFECSECDFKCTSEIDIIQHSTIHQYSNNTNDSLSNIYISLYDTSENNDLGAYKKSTRDGHLNAKTIIDESGSLSCQSEPSQNNMGLTNSSQVPLPHKRSYTPRKTPTRGRSSGRTNSEVEVDNTGIYIPPGWKRKVFMRSSLTKGLITYDCYYYSESGKNFRSKKDAYEYASKNHLTGVDFAKLNFTVSQITSKTDQTTFELDLDNSNIYIPEGWQRKVCMTTISNGQKKYHINYLNPEGEHFGCKSDVYTYLSHSGSIEENQFDVEKMDFSKIKMKQLNLN
ncbi:unnamed protein product [Meganyctiphanes norvegica]|uniref:MBD domain-containing protein n=1 Tax=Meganyctiphanes norvegica TaxID=48144 RepID=A0AAV2QP41_MEGNR